MQKYISTKNALIVMFIMALVITFIYSISFSSQSDLNFHNNKFKITEDGGLAIPFTNNTGSISKKGNVVKVCIASFRAVILTSINDTRHIGIIYTDGVPNGGTVWVVVTGFAKVLLDENTGSAFGNWVSTGNVGTADATNGVPPDPISKYKSIGYSLETIQAGGPGTNILLHILMKK